MYAASFDQNKRKLARPILEELVEEGNDDAILFFAQLEFVGQLGNTSDRLFKEYYQRIKDKDSSVIKGYEEEKAEMETVIELHFPSIKKLYNENNHLCEQPLEHSISALEKNANTYLVAKYFNQCLAKYSIMNSRQRLQAMSKFQAIVCSTKKNGKICISEGYDALSSGLNSVEHSFTVATVVRDIYTSYKELLRKKSGVQKRYPSSKTTDVVTKAFDTYNENNLDKSSEMLINYLNNEPKLSSYDIASVQRIISNFLYLREKEGDIALAIEYANKALNSNELYFKEHWELFDFLSNLYISNEEYSKYIKMIGDYILENQGDMDLIPIASLPDVSHHMANI
ncbi:hypothetical protein Sden_1856 [Shewanella denitrificans OS217]|jgi:hypothetical protein|uniref:Uncharacterized protein n=1 Tax=Shewanella denitrificans (strain OS217 / ATCC BAA-1090 / DSM 15013) TaxID=318161 RepID=Q12N36_SHEDO|nr:hypothetical protein [Shewanella denitrificans]ABE55140.1 hypothetical protein Sden_1856 [Shewanella denitrificans OS217]